MIVGVGIDMARISEFEKLCADVEGAFAKHTFTDNERAFAIQRPCPGEAFAGMFAVKEAVTKAICTRVPDEWIDFRRIEVEHDVHGAPHVARIPPLSDFLDAAGVLSLFVSITNEGDYAAAVAVAEGFDRPAS